jgi:hypothetical protein
MLLGSQQGKRRHRQPLLGDLLSKRSQCALAPWLIYRDYSGPIVKVRRDGGSAGTTDIYARSPYEDVRWQIAEYCAGVNGFLDTFYDQSGNARDWTAASTSNQPKLFDSSTGLQLSSNQMGAKFDGSNHWLQYATDTLGITGNPDVMIAQLCHFGTANTLEFGIDIGPDSSAARIAMYYSSSDDNPRVNHGGAYESDRNSHRTERALGYDLIRRASGATVTGTVFRQNGTDCTESANSNGSSTISVSNSGGIVFGRNGTSTNTTFYFSGYLVAFIALLSNADQDQYAIEQDFERRRVA